MFVGIPLRESIPVFPHGFLREGQRDQDAAGETLRRFCGKDAQIGEADDLAAPPAATIR